MTERKIALSIEDDTSTMRTLRTSVVIANPNRNIITIGIPISISKVRRSRNMWRASFIINDMNVVILSI